MSRAEYSQPGAFHHRQLGDERQPKTKFSRRAQYDPHLPFGQASPEGPLLYTLAMRVTKSGSLRSTNEARFCSPALHTAASGFRRARSAKLATGLFH